MSSKKNNKVATAEELRLSIRHHRDSDRMVTVAVSPQLTVAELLGQLQGVTDARGQFLESLKGEERYQLTWGNTQLASSQTLVQAGVSDGSELSIGYDASGA